MCQTSAFLFVAGFTLGTASIHVCGVLIAYVASRNQKTLMFLRFAGAFFSGAGFQMIITMG
ncbi:MAG: HupE/UreJ family protein [Chitinispirillaceae bacterium]|nr:HupE/UreJ family protein [Chitinispirillaceae bacterium]